MSEPVEIGPAMQRRIDELLRRADGAEPVDLADEVEGDLEEHRRDRWFSLIPSKFLHASLDDFEGEPRAELAGWASRPAGRNLILLGPVGTGKSHAAVAAVRDAHERGLEILFRPVDELLDDIAPGAPRASFDRIVNVDRLIIDDLGAEYATEWSAHRLYVVINRRWLEERPTIVTTNAENRAQLTERLGERTVSRLAHDAVTVGLRGEDRRRKTRGGNK